MGFVLQAVLQVGSCHYMFVITWQTYSVAFFSSHVLGDSVVVRSMSSCWESSERETKLADAFNEINSLLNVFPIPLHWIAFFNECFQKHSKWWSLSFVS